MIKDVKQWILAIFAALALGLTAADAAAGECCMARAEAAAASDRAPATMQLPGSSHHDSCPCCPGNSGGVDCSNCVKCASAGPVMWTITFDLIPRDRSAVIRTVLSEHAESSAVDVMIRPPQPRV